MRGPTPIDITPDIDIDMLPADVSSLTLVSRLISTSSPSSSSQDPGASYASQPM